MAATLTLNDLAIQSKQISDLVNRTRDYLVKPFTVRYFLEHPALGQTLITNANGLKSKVIILYGLKESLVQKIEELERQGAVVDATAVDILPSREDLLGGRAQNWLSAGDIIGGWIGYLADRPRVIDSVTLTGYTWHFLGNDTNVKGPGLGYNRVDKWLQNYGWVKLTGTDIGSIYTEQSAEITALAAQLQYFEQRQFLAA